jgi:NAD(P)-dependent dehydrogenase (short-subunit alcohol dehydrogenase family)
MSEPQRIALVTGANRGIGFETVRHLARAGLKTILTSRDGLTGKAAADKLQSEGLNVVYYPLDITRPESVRRIAEFIDNSFNRLDVLINNAGVFLEGALDHPQDSSILDVSVEVVKTTMETNLYGTLRLTQGLVPFMRRHHYGRIVNVSTGMAQLAEMRGSFPAYRMSNTALNALTRILAAELHSENILVNAVDPGWARTRLGGPNAPRTAADAAEGIVWAATLSSDAPTGAFFRDKQPIPW